MSQHQRNNNAGRNEGEQKANALGIRQDDPICRVETDETVHHEQVDDQDLVAHTVHDTRDFAHDPVRPEELNDGCDRSYQKEKITDPNSIEQLHFVNLISEEKTGEQVETHQNNALVDEVDHGKIEAPGEILF